VARRDQIIAELRRQTTLEPAAAAAAAAVEAAAAASDGVDANEDDDDDHSDDDDDDAERPSRFFSVSSFFSCFSLFHSLMSCLFIFETRKFAYQS